MHAGVFLFLQKSKYIKYILSKLNSSMIVEHDRAGSQFYSIISSNGLL